MKLAKILAPTDLSKLSRASVRYALEMAMAQGGEVIVYNVIAEDGDWFSRDDALDPAKALMPKQRERLAELSRSIAVNLSARSPSERLSRSAYPTKK